MLGHISSGLEIGFVSLTHPDLILALKGRRFEDWTEIEQAVYGPPPTGLGTSIPSYGGAVSATAWTLRFSQLYY
jgi:hypothetical protein